MHALEEVWRVLKPGGKLIDLRPEAEQSQVGVTQAGQFLQIGETRISFDDFMAADRALDQVIKLGQFHLQHTARFLCTLIAPSYKQLRDWIHDPDVPSAQQYTDRLVDQVRQAVKGASTPARITIRHHILLQALEKRRSS